MVTIQFDKNQIAAILKNLNELPKYVGKEQRRKILLKAARPMIAAARSRIRDSDKTHVRYARSGKQGKGVAKGKGRKIATYHPGNLKRSIGVLSLRKTPDVFVGPRFRKDPAGEYSTPSKVDGYYAAMVEYGGKKNRAARPFMRPAFEETKGQVLKIIADGVKSAVDKYKSKHGNR